MKRILILALATVIAGLGFDAQAQTITDAGYHTIGHARGVPAKWAAYFFFFR